MNIPSLVFESQWAFAFTVAILLVGLAEVGYRVGLRLFAAKDEPRRSQISGVQGAVLGLLGLLLGFTFSMAVSRYETRRELVQKEANSIGTTWLRASLLPEPHSVQARALLRRFVDVRVETQKISNDPAKLADGLKQGGEIENELWQHAKESAQKAPTPITASFIVSLNEMIDTDAERLTAARNRIPNGVWVLLIIVATVGCLISAYGSGAQGARSALTNLLLPLLVTIVIVLIYDFMDTHQGVVSVDQTPMLELQKTVQQP